MRYVLIAGCSLTLLVCVGWFIALAFFPAPLTAILSMVFSSFAVAASLFTVARG